MALSLLTMWPWWWFPISLLQPQWRTAASTSVCGRRCRYALIDHCEGGKPDGRPRCAPGNERPADQGMAQRYRHVRLCVCGALLPVDQGRQSGCNQRWRRTARSAVGTRRGPLVTRRWGARCPQGPGQRGLARRARCGDAHHRQGAGPPQSGRHQLHPDLRYPRHPGVGRSTLSSNTDWTYIPVRRPSTWLRPRSPMARSLRSLSLTTGGCGVDWPHDHVVLDQGGETERCSARRPTRRSSRDVETNPQDQIDHGMVVMEVGIAPVKPAEFVISGSASCRNPASKRRIDVWLSGLPTDSSRQSLVSSSSWRLMAPTLLLQQGFGTLYRHYARRDDRYKGWDVLHEGERSRPDELWRHRVWRGLSTDKTLEEWVDTVATAKRRRQKERLHWCDWHGDGPANGDIRVSEWLAVTVVGSVAERLSWWNRNRIHDAGSWSHHPDRSGPMNEGTTMSDYRALGTDTLQPILALRFSVALMASASLKPPRWADSGTRSKWSKTRSSAVRSASLRRCRPSRLRRDRDHPSTLEWHHAPGLDEALGCRRWGRQRGPQQRHDCLVRLSGKPGCWMEFERSWPISYSVADLDISDASVVTETIKITHEYLERTTTGLQTEFAFRLPKGFVDSAGTLHVDGLMRRDGTRRDWTVVRPADRRPRRSVSQWLRFRPESSPCRNDHRCHAAACRVIVCWPWASPGLVWRG